MSLDNYSPFWPVLRPLAAPLKNMKVSWDHYSQFIWKTKSHVPNHQPDIRLPSKTPFFR